MANPSYSFAINADSSGAMSALNAVSQRVSSFGDTVAGSNAALSQMNLATQMQSVQAFGQQINATGQGMFGFSRDALGSAISAGADFEAAMNQVAAVARVDLGSTAFSQLEQEALRLGKTTRFSANEAAGAMNYLAMAGFEVEDVLSSTQGVMSLASAGNLDLASTADISSDILSAYAPALDNTLSKSEQLAGVNDILANTFTRSNTNLQMLGDAFKYVAPVAAQNGVAFEQTAAALGILANSGRKSTQGGTDLRGALTKLQAPSGKAATALDSIGFSIDNFRDSAGNLDLSGIFEFLNAAQEAGNFDATAMRDVFGLTGLTGAQILMSNTDELRKLIATNESAQGSAAKVAETQIQGLSGNLKLFESAMEGFKIAVAQSGIQDFFAGIVGVAGRVVQSLAGLPQPILAIGAGLLTAVGAIGGILVVGGSLLALLGGIGAGISSLLATLPVIVPVLSGIGGAFTAAFVPALPIIAGVAAAAFLIYRAWEPISSFIGGIGRGFLRAMEPMKFAIAGIKEELSDLFSTLAPTFEMLFGQFSTGSDSAQSFGDSVGQFLGGIVWGITSIVHGLTMAVNLFANFGTAIGEGLAILFYGTEEGVGGILNFAQNLKQTWDFGMNAVRNTLTAASNAIVNSPVIGLIQTVLTSISTVFSSAIAWLQQQWVQLTTMFAQIGTIVSLIFTSAIAWLQQQWVQLTTLFAQVGAIVSTIFTSAIAWVQQQWAQLTMMFAQIGSIISMLFTSAIAWIQQQWAQMVAMFAQIGATVSQIFTALSQQMVAVGQQVMSLIQPAIQPFMDLWGWLRNKFAEVSAFVRENVEFFIQAIQGLFNALASFAQNIQGQLSRFNPFGGGVGGSPASSSNTSGSNEVLVTGGSNSSTVIGNEGGDSLSEESGIGSLGSAMFSSTGGEEIPASLAVSTPGAQAAGITNSVANTQNITSGGINVSAINITNTSGDPAAIVDETLRQLDAAFDEEMAARMA